MHIICITKVIILSYKANSFFILWTVLTPFNLATLRTEYPLRSSEKTSLYFSRFCSEVFTEPGYLPNFHRWQYNYLCPNWVCKRCVLLVSKTGAERLLLLLYFYIFELTKNGVMSVFPTCARWYIQSTFFKIYFVVFTKGVFNNKLNAI